MATELNFMQFAKCQGAVHM